MDYNKLMEELDKEVSSSFESIDSKGISKSATEMYDEVEKDLMSGLDIKSTEVEVEGEDDLIFEDGEGVNPEDQEENESAEDLMVKAVKVYFESLLNEEEMEAEEAVNKVLEIVKSVLPKEEGEDSQEVEEESDTEEELKDNSDIEKDSKSSTEGCNNNKKEKPSFEEYQKEKEAKMLERYKQLANRDEEVKKVAIEGLGEIDISIDDRAISRVSGEYGYSGKNLRKMVAEAIQRGDI